MKSCSLALFLALFSAFPCTGYNLPDSTLDPPGNLGPLCFYPDNPQDRLYVFPWDSGVSHTVLDPAFNRPASDHKGYAVDWDLITGTRVLASRAGNITYFLGAGTDNAGVKITHSDRDSVSVYATSDYYIHIVLDSSLTRLGQRVERGQVIGRVGSMNHLHLEIQVAGHVGIGKDGRTTEDVPYPFVEFTARPDGIPWHGDVCTSVNKVFVPAGIRGSFLPVRSKTMTLAVSPNPFRSVTVVDLLMPEAGQGDVRIYDLRGRQISVLFSGPLQPGPHRFSWVNPGSLGTGAYLIRAESGREALAEYIAIVR